MKDIKNSDEIKKHISCVIKHMNQIVIFFTFLPFFSSSK